MLNLFVIRSRLFILMNSAKKKSRGNPLDVIDILFQIYFYKIIETIHILQYAWTFRKFLKCCLRTYKHGRSIAYIFYVSNACERERSHETFVLCVCANVADTLVSIVCYIII